MPVDDPEGVGDEITMDVVSLDLEIHSARHEHTAGEMRLWQNYRHAPEWFADALGEARSGTDHGSRRREILFAVTFAESYLVEWLIVEALERDFEAFRRYLPAEDRRDLTKRWKEVPRDLREAGILPDVPSTGDKHGEEWDRLIQYRHGLVHGAASRPETAGLAQEWLPYPTKSVLDALEPGWAVRIVAERVRRLHGAAATDAPEWLEDP